MADLAVENEEKSKKIEELQNEIEQLKTANRNLKDGANKRMISKMKKRKKWIDEKDTVYIVLEELNVLLITRCAMLVEIV